MKMRYVLLKTLVATFATISAGGSYAQNVISLFPSPVDVRQSNSNTSENNPNPFNTTTIDLSCTQPIQARLSSTSNGSGNVLVDNRIFFNLAGAYPVNLCLPPLVEDGVENSCYNSAWPAAASSGGLDGQNPNLLASTLGVSPFDISTLLKSGSQQATFTYSDTEGQLAGSTLYLITNCTSNGVVGGGQVTGNPISNTNPTPQQLTQNFVFNANANQQVQFNYDLSEAESQGTLSTPNGNAPSTGTTPLDPSTFQSLFLKNTSFATANCLLHTGQLFNNAPACELSTLTCQVGTNPAQTGTLCPKSQQPNEIFQEMFDGSSFTLPDISIPNGPTFHQGVGFLEAQDDWGGGPCTFDPASSLAGAVCPQNVLTSFTGPGAYTSGGRGQSPNSSFVTVAPVPEDLTTVKIPGQQPGYWINQHTFTANFVTTPPSVPGQNTFVASPIESLTYGISGASSVPPSGTPVPGDIKLADVTCPGTEPAAVFTPPAQSISVGEDGQYLLHYLAQDCAGTQEQKFTQTNGNWATSFYTFPVNVDTVAPVVFSGPSLSPGPSNGNSYLVGQKVWASYRCTDDLSGVTKCGTYTYAPGATKDTGVLTTPVDTSKPGSQTFTVKVVDAAGNKSSASVTYQVISSAPVNLFILKLAPLAAKQWSQITYAITVTNLGKQAASSVAITDALPQGVNFVKASIKQAGCNGNQCSNAPSCSFSGGAVICSVPSVTLFTPVLAEIVVQVQASAGTKIKNTATVDSANPEGYPNNTQSSATTLVTK